MADLSDIQTVEHDVVVIGAGGAGLRAVVGWGRFGELFAYDDETSTFSLEDPG